jgi:hypothetical protein
MKGLPTVWSVMQGNRPAIASLTMALKRLVRGYGEFVSVDAAIYPVSKYTICILKIPLYQPKI